MPTTTFTIEEKYTYLDGLRDYHQSEALPGANPIAQNNPQVGPYKLVTESLSGSAFASPRAASSQTWLYRVSASLNRGKYVPYSSELTSAGEKEGPLIYDPNYLTWKDFGMEPGYDWVTSQKVICQSGDIAIKTGLAYSVYAATKHMPPNSAFLSSDGDYLIVPQSGALDIHTEFGNILLRPCEIAVIPRGVKYQVNLVGGPARGYICELFHGHYQLPELGTLGSSGLANPRDFQVPKAIFDGTVSDGVATCEAVDWTVIRKFNGKLFSCTQGQTPFDVAAWHGTYYPYKYDLGRFNVIGSLLYDHPDPSIFTVLTAPSYREPGTALVDFAVFPPRWQVMEDTYWLPPFHMNTMSEFIGMIMKEADPSGDLVFKPFGAMMTRPMTPHGSTKKEHEEERTKEFKPKKIATEPFLAFLFESEVMMGITEAGLKNVESM
ncbi:Homogentisate 1,2-dioxygenase [Curvularia clavata]|uniref:homogentisate 1,2-dioxygenase n=1 Tax=Curvularia clavata TaxID=95742 RepID=A0A9Q8Z2K4_CURCL|nr:Homogentisate 1,2-dioxygenase [Curvularia clavata]